MRIARLIALIVSISAPSRLALHAQAAPPRPPTSSSRFDAGIVAGGEWLQVNALPMDRDALQSASFDLSLRHNGWLYGAGWLRIARDLSTVQGGTLSFGRLVHWGPVQFIPAVSVLGGQAYASNDSTGYDFIDAQGVPGHTPRYTYSDAFTFGGGLGLTAEYSVYRMVGLRLSAAQWFFSGAPLAADRARTLVGLGLSVRVMR